MAQINGRLNTTVTDNLFGTHSLVSCYYGYLINGQQYLVANCTENGHWSTEATCSGDFFNKSIELHETLYGQLMCLKYDSRNSMENNISRLILFYSKFCSIFTVLLFCSTLVQLFCREQSKGLLSRTGNCHWQSGIKNSDWG